MPPEMVEALKPDYVAPFVAFLCHESNTETGSVFECGSGWAAKVRWQRAGGVGFPINQPLTPEHIAQQWSKICAFDDGRATYPLTTQDSFVGVQQNFDNKGNSGSSGKSSAKSGGISYYNSFEKRTFGCCKGTLLDFFFTNIYCA